METAGGVIDGPIFLLVSNFSLPNPEFPLLSLVSIFCSALFSVAGLAIYHLTLLASHGTVDLPSDTTAVLFPEAELGFPCLFVVKGLGVSKDLDLKY